MIRVTDFKQTNMLIMTMILVNTMMMIIVFSVINDTVDLDHGDSKLTLVGDCVAS